MANVEEITDEIRDIFCKYKEKQKIDLFRTLNSVSCCECGHQSRIKDVQSKLCWYKKMTNFYQVILGFLVTMLFVAIYALWAARRYNRARSFGNGACVSTFFWTYDDCTVLY